MNQDENVARQGEGDGEDEGQDTQETQGEELGSSRVFNPDPTNPEWTDELKRRRQARVVRVGYVSEGFARSLAADGPCPYCEHDLSVSEPRAAYFDAQVERQEWVKERLECDCGMPHEGRPADSDHQGCGTVMRPDVRWV